MKIPLFQVDAFTAELFRGNPAAVCPLDEWLPEPLLQSIAAENNLSETAFFVRRGGRFELRWFTPTVEVDLCGHATLASAFVILHYLEPDSKEVVFETRSGELRVKREDDWFAMDFPARPPSPCPEPPELAEALGAAPREVWSSRDLLAVLDSEKAVRELTPRFELLRRLDTFAVIVTAPGDEADFVSRFFAPRAGVDEDPVTGSAHCTLIPYWAGRLAKSKLRALQVSRRGGELLCEHHGTRVTIKGRCVLFLEGYISVGAAVSLYY
ncbi:MAG: PhzF family phenazine biosynthesis protein [Bryobacteraceae bacterium]